MEAEIEKAFADETRLLKAAPQLRVSKDFAARVMAATAADRQFRFLPDRSAVFAIAASIVALLAACAIFFRPVPKFAGGDETIRLVSVEVLAEDPVEGPSAIARIWEDLKRTARLAFSSHSRAAEE